MKSKLFRFVFFMLSGAFLILVTPYFTRAEGENNFSQESQPIAILVDGAPVVKESLEESLFFVGDIKAKDEAMVYSKVNGKLIDYKVDEGDKVKKEDMIAILDRDEVGFKFQEAPVLSTISGTVGRTYLDRGANIRLDTVVALIVNIDEVRVRIAVEERHIPKIRLGQKAKVRVDAYPDKIFEGTITKVSPVVDNATRTAPIEVTIPNSDHQLLPGMFANVDIIVRVIQDALIVPEEAVVASEGKTFVYVIEDSKALRKDVVLGIRKPGKVQVIEGLTGEEKVVVAGQQKIKEGSLISVKTEIAE